MSSKETAAALLRKRMEGEVRDDLMARHYYSVDASILQVTPDCIALPRTKEDLLEIVRTAQECHLPIIPRGGATGIAGGCLGEGIIVDTSKYLNRILEYNPKEGYAICEPGVIQDQLNQMVAANELRLGPDTSTGNRATIGGMCATNAAGSHYLKYGSMIDHVLGLELILSNGKAVWLDETSDWPQLPEIRDPPRFHRSSSGYPLYTLLEKPRNLAKLMVGSEGTLGLFTAIKLKLSPQLRERSLILLPFPTQEACLEAVPHILESRPISLEMIDTEIITMGRLSPALKGHLSWLDFEPTPLLIAEYESEKPPKLFPHQRELLAKSTQEEVWALRKSGLGLLLSRRSYTRAIAFIEDLAVPPNQLASMVRQLKKIVPWKMNIYGHAGDGCLHIRPYVTVSNPQEMQSIFTIMPQVADLVRTLGGTLTGEHGDGLIRSWLNPHFFSSETYAAMVKVKEAFDPINLMNPGKIVKGRIPTQDLQISHPTDFPTFLNFKPEGGFHLAADLCNGNGACRKQSGLMCPSFQAFKDEKHSTRARAQSLRSILNKQIPLSEWTGKGLLDVLDYCLACKGCKKECPSQVDMAKMKIEQLYQYQEKEGYFLKNRLFGNLHRLSAWGSKFPPLLKLAQPFLKAIGITTERAMPSLSKKRFTTWWKGHTAKKGKEKVSLFVDTYTEYYHPEIGIAAVELLEKSGFQVTVIPPFCCGRPFLSAGMLKEAKKQAEQLAERLKQVEGPLVVLEPSCLSALQDDYSSLIGSSIKAFPIEEILPPQSYEDSFFYHPHCHEQALFSHASLKNRFPNLILSQSGCCGLAGSFGYEENHYEMSMAIAENGLFPQIRSLPNLPIVTSGFSCRQQIEHGLGVKALHPAEMMNRLIIYK